MSSDSNYQAELDGLRALAVMAVLLGHLNVPWMTGGFVGVDIFFVLSGFLITRLIVSEIRDSGRFSFGNFYVRRIRRLYPALLCTVIVSWVGAFLLLSPDRFADFANSALAALLSYSNIYFYAEADYFDALATSKPLLHSWSLSVEEQFYLIWPLILLLLTRFGGARGAMLGAVAICLASLALSQWWLTADGPAAFYLLPSRAVELGLGALLVWLKPIGSGRLLNIATIAGLAAMIAPMIVYTAETPFPGLAAMLPAGGAALFIAGARSRCAMPFALPPVAWLGRISYSLYLVHWPLIVLWRAYFYREPAGLEPWLLATVAIGLAWAQYSLVEQRFRLPVKGRNRWLIATLAGIAALVGATSLAAARSEGWIWRIPAERLTATGNPISSPEFCGRPDPRWDPDLVTCQNARGRDQDLFVWGDSHALHLAAGLADAYPDFNIFVLYRSSCAFQSGLGGYVQTQRTDALQRACVDFNRRALDFFTTGPARNIIVTGYRRKTPQEMSAVTAPITAQLRAHGNKVAFLGDIIRPGVNLLDCSTAPAFVVGDEWMRERCAADPSMVRRDLAYNDEMDRLSADFIAPDAVLCPDGVCDFFEDGRLLFRDDHHLSVYGSQQLVARMKPLLPF